MDLFHTYANEIILIGSTLTSILIIWKILIPTFKVILAIIRDGKEHVQLVKSMAQEFKPNGGSSLRDSINRLEASNKSIQNDLKDIKLEAQRMGAKQWALVATQKEPVFETDAKGELVRVNIMYLNLVERPIEDLRGYGWENVLHPDDRDKAIEEWQEAVRKQRSFEGVYRIISAVSHKTYRVYTVATPYFSSDLEVMGYIGRLLKIEPLDS